MTTTSRTELGKHDPPEASDPGARRRLAAPVTLVLSLLACYGTLAALAALSALGVTLALNPGIWAGVIVLFAVLAATAVALGARRHGSMLPVLPALAGVALLGYVMFGRFDRVLELVAFALLGAAVFWDHRLRVRSGRAGGGMSRRKLPSGDRVAISSFCRTNLEIQGMTGFSDDELLTHRPGVRFAYQLCFAITLLGTVFQSIPLLAIAATASFLAVFPPNHPFDYVYNLTVGRLMRRPKLPPRTNQGRFACAIATVWLSVTIYFFATGWTAAGTAMGMGLLIPAGLVGFFDVCLPSMLYNAVAYRQLKPR